MRRKTDVVVLLSGGIDSTATLAFYLDQGFQAKAAFVSYGQPAADEEQRAALRVAEHYGVHIDTLDWRGRPKGLGLIHGRNGFLLLAALLEHADNPKIVAIGVHAGTPYPDCTAQFIHTVQRVYDIYTGGTTQIGAPFIHWNKADIWAYCCAHHIPVSKTYSCEKGESEECGTCPSCKERERLDACS